MRLGLSEIAKRLDLHSDTLERWIRQGRIPVKRVGNFGVFSENELNKWEDQHRSAPKAVDPEEKRDNGPSIISLSSAMERGGCHHGLDGSSKKCVLRSAVNHIPGLSETIGHGLFSQLMEREELMSTGIGKGVAIPHPRNPLKEGLEHPMILTCFPNHPVEFQSIDDQPVFVLFLLLSHSIETHLGLLSRLSFCLRDNAFVDFLKQSPGPERFFEKIVTLEKAIDKKGI